MASSGFIHLLKGKCYKDLYRTLMAGIIKNNVLLKIVSNVCLPLMGLGLNNSSYFQITHIITTKWVARSNFLFSFSFLFWEISSIQFRGKYMNATVNYPWAGLSEFLIACVLSHVISPHKLILNTTLNKNHSTVQLALKSQIKWVFIWLNKTNPTNWTGNQIYVT